MPSLQIVLAQVDGNSVLGLLWLLVFNRIRICIKMHFLFGPLSLPLECKFLEDRVSIMSPAQSPGLQCLTHIWWSVTLLLIYKHLRPEGAPLFTRSLYTAVWVFQGILKITFRINVYYLPESSLICPNETPLKRLPFAHNSSIPQLWSERHLFVSFWIVDISVSNSFLMWPVLNFKKKNCIM